MDADAMMMCWRHCVFVKRGVELAMSRDSRLMLGVGYWVHSHSAHTTLTPHSSLTKLFKISL